MAAPLRLALPALAGIVGVGVAIRMGGASVLTSLHEKEAYLNQLKHEDSLRRKIDMQLAPGVEVEHRGDTVVVS